MGLTTEKIKTPKFSSENQTDDNFQYWSKILKNGLWAGLTMMAYLVLLELSNSDHTIWLKFVKYIFLAMILGILLKNAKNYYPPVAFFKQGIKLGAGTSIIAGLVLMGFNFLLFLVMPDLSLNKFSLEASNIGQLIILDVVILFEIFVYGMIITFICLQFLKYQNPDGEKAF